MRGFDHIESWIFDLDNTLYPAECNLFAQIDQKMGEFISNYLSVEWDEARVIQKSFFREYGTTMNGMMTVHDMDPHEFMDFVHDIDHSPVEADAALDAALAKLPGRKIVYTNGSVAHAEAVLDRLAVRHHFEHLHDIAASDFKPKPQLHGYQKLMHLTDVDPAKASFFEDMARNLLEPHNMGMTTVHVLTGDDWAREGGEDEHVHHRTDDLPGFLAALT